MSAKNKQPPPAATGIPSSNDTQSSDPGCPDRKDRRESDLCAQWKAADAASNQVSIGWLGLLLGSVTMGAAIAAALYARDAAKETKRSADAAVSTIENSRAWVTFYDIETMQGNDRTLGPFLGLTVRFLNTGASPAINADINLGYEFVPTDDPAPFIEIGDDKSGNGGVIGPGQKMVSGTVHITGKDRLRFFSREADCYFRATVWYNDIYSETPRKTDVFLELVYVGEHREKGIITNSRIVGTQYNSIN
ncbi:MAG: hypothetical protein OSB00_02235 [Sphingomonas bacterium]|nr:hypothetical protein [Sphingomonas bacterium]